MMVSPSKDKHSRMAFSGQLPMCIARTMTAGVSRLVLTHLHLLAERSHPGLIRIHMATQPEVSILLDHRADYRTSALSVLTVLAMVMTRSGLIVMPLT